jgi:hypothetical protein
VIPGGRWAHLELTVGCYVGFPLKNKSCRTSLRYLALTFAVHFRFFILQCLLCIGPAPSTYHLTGAGRETYTSLIHTAILTCRHNHVLSVARAGLSALLVAWAHEVVLLQHSSLTLKLPHIIPRFVIHKSAHRHGADRSRIMKTQA